jgi:hypothetical protein
MAPCTWLSAALRLMIVPASTAAVSREARTRTRMDLERREYGRMIGYEANGSFGQYIDIYPDQRLVAVRMIAVTDRFSVPADSFENFRELVRALAPH